jgi:hypothetical protein
MTISGDFLEPLVGPHMHATGGDLVLKTLKQRGTPLQVDPYNKKFFSRGLGALVHHHGSNARRCIYVGTHINALLMLQLQPGRLSHQRKYTMFSEPGTTALRLCSSFATRTEVRAQCLQCLIKLTL